MKVLAYINWVFFLVVISVFAYDGIEGLARSYDNNYFEEQQLDSVLVFSDSVKILTTILNDDFYADNFPFHLFTHLIVGENRRERSFTTYHKNLLNGFKGEQLEDLDLLLNIELADIKEDDSNKLIGEASELLNEAYIILDTLGKRFPNTNQGLVFEVDITESFDDLAETISAIDRLISSKGSKQEGTYKNYLCFRFLKGVEVDVDKIGSLGKRLQNYGGQIVKTFHYYQDAGRLDLFERMGFLLSSILTTNHNLDLSKTIFCFPTYPLISVDKEGSKVVLLGEAGEFEEAIDEVTDENNLITKSQKIGETTLDYYKIASIIDTSYIRITETRKDTIYRSAIEGIDTIPVSTEESVIRQDSNRFRVIDTIKEVSTSYNKPIFESIDFAFEDRETLTSKIEFAIRSGVNIGFWNIYPIVHQDESVSTLENPIMGLFKFAKGNFVKKVGKKPGTLKEIVVKPVFEKDQSDASSWVEASKWYWPTVEKYINKPKTPDYLLFFLVPLLVLKFLLPSFTLLFFRGVNLSAGDHFLKPLRVKFLNTSISARTLLRLDVLFWLVLFVLFIFTWYSEETGVGYTTRNFAFLLLLIAALGRPIVKFAIKLVRLVGKPFKIKKVIKLLPYLGEMIYYNLAEEEREKSVTYIKGTDRNKNVFATSKIVARDTTEPNSKDTDEFGRLTDYFGGKKFREKSIAQDKRAEDRQRPNLDKKGRGDLKVPSWFVALFRLLFILLSTFIVWYFEYQRFDRSILANLDFTYAVVLFIFIIEIIVITYNFFEEYYIYYLTKLFARNV